MELKRIPATMATQHPDSASTYVPVQKEPEEALDVLKPINKGGFGIDEYMIDFEGKMTPYLQPSEIALRLLSEGLEPGKDVFLTPRIPSVTQETVFRQLMALMAITEAIYRVHGMIPEPHVTGVIHPMSESSNELLETRRRVLAVISLTNKEFGTTIQPDWIHLIPLVEAVPHCLSFPRWWTNILPGAGNSVYRIRRFVSC